MLRYRQKGREETALVRWREGDRDGRGTLTYMNIPQNMWTSLTVTTRQTVIVTRDQEEVMSAKVSNALAPRRINEIKNTHGKQD